jgi:hypothetical protein
MKNRTFIFQSAFYAAAAFLRADLVEWEHLETIPSRSELNIITGTVTSTMWKGLRHQ